MAPILPRQIVLAPSRRFKSFSEVFYMRLQNKKLTQSSLRQGEHYSQPDEQSAIFVYYL